LHEGVLQEVDVVTGMIGLRWTDGITHLLYMRAVDGWVQAWDGLWVKGNKMDSGWMVLWTG